MEPWSQDYTMAPPLVEGCGQVSTVSWLHLHILHHRPSPTRVRPVVTRSHQHTIPLPHRPHGLAPTPWSRVDPIVSCWPHCLVSTPSSRIHPIVWRPPNRLVFAPSSGVHPLTSTPSSCIGPIVSRRPHRLVSTPSSRVGPIVSCRPHRLASTPSSRVHPIVSCWPHCLASTPLSRVPHRPHRLASTHRPVSTHRLASIVLHPPIHPLSRIHPMNLMSTPSSLLASTQSSHVPRCPCPASTPPFRVSCSPHQLVWSIASRPPCPPYHLHRLAPTPS